ISYYEKSIIPFEDVYFDGKIIETGQWIKNNYLNKKIGNTMAKRLKRIESILLDKIHPLQGLRREKIEKIVENIDGHQLEVKAFSRLLSIREARVLLERLHRFTEVDYVHIYELLFNRPGLLKKLARGLDLPEAIEQIIIKTKNGLEKGCVPYEDCAPLLYLKLRVEGSQCFSDIRQVVIDEAQDYYPVQYEVFQLLFNNARYTVLGDINQAIEKDEDISLYDQITDIFAKEKVSKLFLNKSYRSSYEISSFNQGLTVKKQNFIAFNRHETKPAVLATDSGQQVLQALAEAIGRYNEQGYESIAVICKTQKEAEEVYAGLEKCTKVNLISPGEGEIKKGAMVIPSYVAKGLEFDVVLVHGASRENYSTELDRKLLYIACTRALHRLELFCAGEKSPFI
ncbi:MAG: ATP-binding domain-containing protein, partial [Desulfocucumaceae bacterium]